MNANSLKDKISKQDFHVHTFLSPCAKDPARNPREIARAADVLAMEAVALTGHFYEKRRGFAPPPFYSGVNRYCLRRNSLEVEDIDSKVKRILPWAKKLGFKAEDVVHYDSLFKSR